MPERRSAFRPMSRTRISATAPHKQRNLAEKLPGGEEISAGELLAATRGNTGLLASARSGLIVGRYVACPYDRIRDLGGRTGDVCDTRDA